MISRNLKSILIMIFARFSKQEIIFRQNLPFEEILRGAGL
jgi:hypothetical protein